MNDMQSSFRVGELVREQYKVVNLLGQGESGAVYLVTDERDQQKQFALKEVMRAVREERRGFPFEPAELKRLDHPSLPRIHRVFHGNNHDQFYILMDYVEGHNLEVMRRLMPGKRFSLHAAMTLMSPIMDAVSYLHQQHPPLIHGDINLSNIFPPNAGTTASAKLVDFGGGKNVFTNVITQQSMENFRAPEQYGKRTSRRTDVYALGAIFYALLTGAVPAAASDRLAQINAGEPDPLLPMNQFMPINQIVVRAIHCALSISRQDRYSSVEEFRQSLWQVIYANEKAPPISELSMVVPVVEHTGPVLADLMSDPFIDEKNLGRNAEPDISMREVEIPGLIVNTAIQSRVAPPTVSSKTSLSFTIPGVSRSSENVSWREELPVLRRKRRNRKTRRIIPLVLAFLLISVVGSGVAVAGYQTYDVKYKNDVALARVGIKHLQTALSLMQAWSKKPLGAPSVKPAQQEFEAASAEFAQLNNDLQSFPAGATLFPHYGSLLSAALRVVPIAMEISQAGASGCDAINLALDRLREPFGSTFGLKLGDVATIGNDLHQVEEDINLAAAQVSALQPADLRFDARVGKAVAAFHQYLPPVQIFLKEANQTLRVLPFLFGIGAPSYYLVEILDSTELRPGGGFIKDYGFAAISNGRLSAAYISDANLLGRSGQFIPYPEKYRWFDGVSKSWNISDSNLDADFPTAARYAIQNYNLEGGRVPLQGVVAITPALMEQALAITGPISVPELHQTVTAQNLISLIHYYEPWLGGKGSRITNAAGSKQFTALLTDHFLKKFRQIRSSAIAALFQMLVTSLRSKDLQIFFQNPSAESLLRLSNVDATIQAPTSDSLFVVDANTSADNANQFITGILDDRVTIDGSGDATHHTTIHYAWLMTGNVFGSQVYSDYVRVYAPPGSSLQEQQGWQPQGARTAFGRRVWAGSFTLSAGQTKTITLAWTEKGVAKKDVAGWHYQYLIQRQASTNWRLNLQVTLPSCAVKTHTSGGIILHNMQIATFNQTVYEDRNLGIDYGC